MSSTTATPDLDYREQLARIDRALAETHKFQAETNKLSEEALKFRRDRFLAPIVVVTALGAFLGGLGGLVTLAQWAARLGH